MKPGSGTGSRRLPIPGSEVYGSIGHRFGAWKVYLVSGKPEVRNRTSADIRNDSTHVEEQLRSVLLALRLVYGSRRPFPTKPEVEIRRKPDI